MIPRRRSQPSLGSLRLLPPPKTKPETFLLRRAVVIANANPHGEQALRRIQRLFLGWSDYDDSEGYENFGGWDPQGPYPSSTCPCV